MALLNKLLVATLRFKWYDRGYLGSTIGVLIA
jgi:hypothetical protein